MNNLIVQRQSRIRKKNLHLGLLAIRFHLHPESLDSLNLSLIRNTFR